MYLEAEVGEVLQWADKVASKRKTSTLSVLIAFDRSYKQVNDIQKAKNYVEQAS